MPSGAVVVRRNKDTASTSTAKHAVTPWKQVCVQWDKCLHNTPPSRSNLKILIVCFKVVLSVDQCSKMCLERTLAMLYGSRAHNNRPPPPTCRRWLWGQRWRPVASPPSSSPPRPRSEPRPPAGLVVVVVLLLFRRLPSAAASERDSRNGPFRRPKIVEPHFICI